MNENTTPDYSIKSNWKLILSGLFTGSYSFFNFFVLNALLNNNELVKLYFADAIWSIPYYTLINMGSAIFFDKGKKINLKGLPIISHIIFIIGIILFIITKSPLFLFSVITLPLNMYIQIASEKLSRDKYKYLHIVSISEIVICMLGNIITFKLFKHQIDFLSLYYINYFIIVLLLIVPMYRLTSKVSLTEVLIKSKTKSSIKEKFLRLKELFLRARPQIIQVTLFELGSIFILKNNDKVANKGLAIVMITKIHSLLKSTMEDVSYLLKKNIVNTKCGLEKQKGYYSLVYKILFIQIFIYLAIILNNKTYDLIYLLNGIITSLLIFYLTNYYVVPQRYYLTKFEKFRITAIASFIDTFIILIASMITQDIFIVQLIRILATGSNALIVSIGYNKLKKNID